MSHRHHRPASSRVCLVMALLLSGIAWPDVVRGAEMLQLTLRSRPANSQGSGGPVSESSVQWDPQHTAVIVCDMWDDHWCRGAAERVGELAKPMNRLLENFRQRGALIIHAPSTCVQAYEGTPARLRAQTAPQATPPVTFTTSMRWGTCWNWPDPTRETDLPIDDSDMGCDCEQKCTIREAWSRQIETLEIAEQDAVTDHAQELYNLLTQFEVKHVAIMGVHLNMCVLGRPFGIRQLVKLGPDVALIRDMTDTMYDHRRPPHVNHFAGTDLVVAHVEKYWCPTFTSDQVTGGEPFRFRDAPSSNAPADE